MALIPVVGKNTHPGVSAQRKEQVPLKIFHAKRIYFLLELQTINTNPKLIRISNVPFRSVGSNRELFTEKKPGTAIASKLDLLACDCELSLYRARNLHSYGYEMIPVFWVGGTLVGRTLGSLRGLGRGTWHPKLLNYDKNMFLHAVQAFKINTTDLRIELIQP